MDDATLEDLGARIAALPRPLLLGLDVDGTLAPIVDDPARAGVPPEVARTLARIGAAEGIVIAIVTGRDMPRLEEMIAMPSAWRVTEHGREIWAPDAGESDAEPITPALEARLARFRAWASETTGARIEDKTASVVVHVRELSARDPEGAAAALAWARERAKQEGLFVREGRAVIEASAVAADKGKALREVARRAGVASIAYAGDDLTDLPAIAAASERGIGIFVRSAERPDPPPGARAVIDGSRDVARLLGALEARLRS